MFNKVRGMALVACLFLVICGALSAQTPTELRLDTMVSGNIRSGGEQWYSVRAAQAGLLTVETSGSVDTYLEAYDASRNSIAENDDGGEDYNAKLQIFVQAGATYLFKLRAFDDESGPYRIWATYKPIPQATELRLDSIVSGNIRAGEDYWYSIRASQAGAVTVQTLGNTDTYLEAYDPAYKLIASNDDGGEDSNARVRVNTEAGKTYLFRLRGYSSTESGAYRIVAEAAAPPVELRLDTQVSGNIRSGSEQWYSVRATQTGFLSVEITGDFDSYLEAYDSSYNLLGEDDDSGGDSNARLDIYAQAGTTYLFKARGYDSSENGPFRIRATYKPIPPAAELRFDAIVSGNIRAGEDYWYSVRPSQAGTVTVGTMGNTDTYLEAYDAAYKLIASDDDSGGGSNAQVEVSVDAGKTYYFRLRAYSRTESGPYRIWAGFERGR